MTKPYRSVPAQEVFADLPPERQARIAARTAELIAEQLALQPLPADEVTALVDGGSGRKLYRYEIQGDDESTLAVLESYVRALGGELHLLVSLPERSSVALSIDGGATGRSVRSELPVPRKRASA